MSHPFLNWCFGLALVIGLPLGLLVALSEGSLLAGFVFKKPLMKWENIGFSFAR
jgi:hypothetical protein